MKKTENLLLKKIWVISLVLILALPAFSAVIKKIEIVGAKKLSPETIKYYLVSSEGVEYDPQRVRKDIENLWATGFFSDIRVWEKDEPDGVVLRFEVKERPVIKEVRIETDRYVKKKDIEDKLKEEGADIIPFSYYNPMKIKRAKKVIEDFLSEKGFALGKVEVEKKIKGDEVTIVFNVKGGGRLRIAKIEIVGNNSVPDSILLRGVKALKTLTLWNLPFIKKTVYSSDALKEAREEIRKKYLNLGFLDVDVKPAKIEIVEGRGLFGQKKKMIKVIFQVNEGNIYRIGEIRIEGNKAFPKELIRRLILLQKNQIYSLQKREDSVKNIQDLYGSIGYIYAQIMPIEEPKPEEHRVDITFRIIENKRVRLHRLSFEGNTYTLDKVMRREFLLAEGDFFNIAAFKDSVLRLKQLGIVDIKKNPDFKPVGDDKMDVVVHVEEMHRNQIFFNAGYGGYFGYFVGGSISTSNFMGRGESVSLFIQYGSRYKSYSIAFTEPYVLDKPLFLTLNLHNTLSIYPFMFTRQMKGGSVGLGFKKGFWHADISYSNDYISLSDVNEDYLGALPEFYRLIWFSNMRIAAVSPSIYRSSVDSPIWPTSGTLYLYGIKFANKALGSETDFVSNWFEFTHYHKFRWGHILGMHFRIQYMKAFGDSTIPIYERIFLGGEQTLRGFEYYRVSPTENNVRIGGTKSILFNLEYEIRMKDSPMSVVFFFDAGNAYSEKENISLGNLYYCTGIEGRVFVEMLRMPFRIIFSYNPKLPTKYDKNFTIRIGMGRTF